MGKIRTELIVTNGKRIVRLAWLENSDGKGIYGSIFKAPAELHMSYHYDGTVHAKINPDLPSRLKKYHNKKGYMPAGMGGKGPALNKFKGFYTVLNFAMKLANESLNRFDEYKLKKAEGIVMVDNRTIYGKDKFCYFHFDLVESKNFDILKERMKNLQRDFMKHDKTMITNYHCFFNQNPWLLVSISHKSR